jgi:hypothetical protein
MMPLLPEHIEVGDWLRMQLRDGCTRIVLRQRVGEIEQHVREWSMGPETDLVTLAEEIRGKMNDEGRQLRGPTLFALFSFRTGQPMHVDRMLRRVEGTAGGNNALFGETEASDARGIVAMMMRHNEASARIALGQTLEIVEHYKSISKERGERVAALEERQEENIKLFERLMSLQHEREMEKLREHRKDEGRAYLRQKIDLVAPVLLSKVLSAGMPKGGGTVMGEEVLRQFLKSLQPEQVQAIIASLGPEQIVSMVELYERYSDREDGSKGAQESGPTTPPRPPMSPTAAGAEAPKPETKDERGPASEPAEKKKE